MLPGSAHRTPHSHTETPDRLSQRSPKYSRTRSMPNTRCAPSGSGATDRPATWPLMAGGS
eukprot:3440806-Prymnesium_polylepis.1